MPIALKVALAAAALVVVIVVAVMLATAPLCDAKSPDGPSIGHAFRIAGC